MTILRVCRGIELPGWWSRRHANRPGLLPRLLFHRMERSFRGHDNRSTGESSGVSADKTKRARRAVPSDRKRIVSGTGYAVTARSLASAALVASVDFSRRTCARAEVTSLFLKGEAIRSTAP